jgi:RNA polymerase sigma factor (sigma-70 family)
MNDSKSIAGFCKKYLLQQSYVCGLLNFKISPRGKRGEWRKPVIQLSEIFHLLPEMICDESFDSIEKNTISLECNVRYLEAIHNKRIGIEEEIENVDLKNKIDEVLKTIPMAERTIIEMRFGLNGNEENMSLEDVGKKFNISKSRVRQIEAKALRRLRHPVRARKLHGFLDKELKIYNESIRRWE